MTTLNEYVAAIVDAAPPLTNEQRVRLASLLNGAAPLPRLDRLAPPPVRRCALYRHWDKDGVLLYVGVSVTPGKRLRDHARHSAFMRFASRTEEVWFDSETEAREAERGAIEAERPLFNRVGADSGRDHRLTHYLIDHEAWDLLGPIS